MGITHEWNGTVLTITSDSGTSSADLKGDMGVRGPQGVAGNVSFNDLTDEQKQSLQMISNTSQLINDGDGDTIEKYLGEADVNKLIADYPKMEWVYGTQTTEAVSKITNKVEDYLDGTQPVRLKVKLPANTELYNNHIAAQISFSNSRSITVRATNWKKSTTETVCCWEVRKKDGMWHITVNPYDKEITTVVGDLTVTGDADKVRYINITTTVPAGTDYSIWGTPIQ